MAKTLFEWVMVLTRDDDVILTENQYRFYKDHWTEGHVFLNGREINPSYVVTSYSRPAQALKELYPCKDCFSSGYLPGGKECPKCKGTGVDLTK